MTDIIWREHCGQGPALALALHDGHALRAEVAAVLALSEAQRLREEDPYTGTWVDIAPNGLVSMRSRFEVDLNRPRDRAIYRDSNDAWGLPLYRQALSADAQARSRGEYDAFYARLAGLCRVLQRDYGPFVVFDLHSYNHRRAGADQPPADPAGNPTINLGLSNLDRRRWAPVVDAFGEALRQAEMPGGPLDVRANVKFQGGHCVHWLHETFPEHACGLAIEVKKVFMDEWTGTLDKAAHGALHRALAGAAAAAQEALPCR